MTARGMRRLVLWQYYGMIILLSKTIQHVPAEKKNSILINEHALNREPVPLSVKTNANVASWWTLEWLISQSNSFLCSFFHFPFFLSAFFYDNAIAIRFLFLAVYLQSIYIHVLCIIQFFDTSILLVYNL